MSGAMLEPQSTMEFWAEAFPEEPFPAKAFPEEAFSEEAFPEEAALFLTSGILM